MNERPAIDDVETTATSLSALMDGECSAAQTDAVCGRWQAHLDTQRSWHAYQLIGDVLRSDELGGSGRDAAFMHRLRQRLADEPVVLAPSARRPAIRRWAAPLGAAAGVALVASAVWVTRPDANALSAGAQLAGAATAPPTGVLPVGNRAPAEADVAQFERYLFAHKQFQPTAPLNPTAGYLRSAVYESNGR